MFFSLIRTSRLSAQRGITVRGSTFLGTVVMTTKRRRTMVKGRRQTARLPDNTRRTRIPSTSNHPEMPTALHSWGPSGASCQRFSNGRTLPPPLHRPLPSRQPLRRTPNDPKLRCLIHRRTRIPYLTRTKIKATLTIQRTHTIRPNTHSTSRTAG